MEGFEVEQVMFIPDLENQSKKKAIVKLKSPVDDSACDHLMKKQTGGS
jgi:RNA recognition motif-containing protein